MVTFQSSKVIDGHASFSCGGKPERNCDKTPAAVSQHETRSDASETRGHVTTKHNKHSWETYVSDKERSEVYCDVVGTYVCVLLHSSCLVRSQPGGSIDYGLIWN